MDDKKRITELELQVKRLEDEVKMLTEQQELSDKMLDNLARPLPSKRMLVLAESIRSAHTGQDKDATFGVDDYGNLLTVQLYIDESLPRLLEDIRIRSIDPEAGWRFEEVKAGNGDHGLCAICKNPFQHFGWTMKVKPVDAVDFFGVCRQCVRDYSPEFEDDERIMAWLGKNPDVCDRFDSHTKAGGQRVGMVDAIRRYVARDSQAYARNLSTSAPEWAHDAFTEWR